MAFTDVSGPQNLVDRPLAFLELLGRSTLERTVEQLQAVEVEATAVLAHWDVFSTMPALRSSFDNVAIMASVDLGFQVALTLKEFAEKGIEHAFVVRPNAYCEADMAEMLACHRDGQALMTRASDTEGPLDFWVVDCDAAWQPRISYWEEGMFGGMLRQGSYFVKQYSKRISHPRDLRTLVVDAFTGRCQIRPSGKEVNPGVWLEEGAQVYRGAQVAGPAFVGRACTIRENTRVATFSNIESCSYVDYGTAIEDATILPNTYVGIGLDVRNSVVQGNRLLNLTRDVVIDIADPGLFHSTAVEGKAGSAKLALMNLLNLTKTNPAEESTRGGIRQQELHVEECFTNIPVVNPRTEFES
jgi:NDP-sugar pyrophosphorylase family protein